MKTGDFVWFDGALVPWEEATVHVMSHAIHYGTGVFEGIRVYETTEGPGVFRLGDHMTRLARSAQAYRIPLAASVAELCSAARQVVTANGLTSGYLRPVVFRGLGARGLDPTAAEVHVAMITWPWGAYLGEAGARQGIRVITSSWRRISADSFYPNAKGTGAYLNSVMARLEAVEAGVEEALLLNAEDEVAEGSGENFFLVRAGRVVTPPPEAGILPGITRESVMTLLADHGYEVAEATLTREDAYVADESFFTGTAAEVTPIREIDGRPIGDGAPGPVTRRAQELFHDAVTGRAAPYRSWVELV